MWAKYSLQGRKFLLAGECHTLQTLVSWIEHNAWTWWVCGSVTVNRMCLSCSPAPGTR